jgi:hypothetical protein
MLLQDLKKRGLISPPVFLPDNTQYLVVMGSIAYGVSEDASDFDVYGFCIPPKEMVFPHLAGHIPGFGRQQKRFEQWQEHHVNDPSAQSGKGREYDFSVSGIVKYFQLVMENNPNMIDSLFVPQNCVLHSTQVGNMVRENRRMFLHKGAWHKFKGYAFSQIHKMKSKKFEGLKEVELFEEEHGIDHRTDSDHLRLKIGAHGVIGAKKDHPLYLPVKSFSGNKIDFHDAGIRDLEEDVFFEYVGLFKKMMEKSKRAERVKVLGFDHKFAYHCVRLLNEIEQIMTEGDLDLLRNREQLKSIRRGEWSLERVEKYFEEKEKSLESLYEKSSLPHSPDEEKIKQLLLDCLEHHYGSLEKAISRDEESQAKVVLREIKQLVEKKRNF